MVHPSDSSAFHPYTRRSAAPQPALEASMEENLRFLFTQEALIALSQLQNTTNPDNTKPVSPISAAPILTPNTVASTPVPVSAPEPLQSPTVSLPNEKCRRKRTTFSPEQATRLESEYLSDSYMAREKRLLLAQSLSLSENQVKTWFQNRRAKDKRDRKTDNSSNNAHSRKSSPSRKSSSDSSPTPSVSGSIPTSSFSLPPSFGQIQTASSPTTVEALLLATPSTPPARAIQKVEQLPTQQQLANILFPNLDNINNYLQSLLNSSGAPLPQSVQSLLDSSPSPLFNPNLLASFQQTLQPATI